MVLTVPQSVKVIMADYVCLNKKCCECCTKYNFHFNNKHRATQRICLDMSACLQWVMHRYRRLWRIKNKVLIESQNNLPSSLSLWNDTATSPVVFFRKGQAMLDKKTNVAQTQILFIQKNKKTLKCMWYYRSILHSLDNLKNIFLNLIIKLFIQKRNSIFL